MKLRYICSILVAMLGAFLQANTVQAAWVLEDLPDLVLDRRPVKPQRLPLGGECNVREIRFRVDYSPAQLDSIEVIYEFWDGRSAGRGYLDLKPDRVYSPGESSAGRDFPEGWRPLVNEEGKCIRALVVHGRSLPGLSANAVIRFSARRWVPAPPPPAIVVAPPPPPVVVTPPPPPMAPAIQWSPERFLGVTALNSQDMSWEYRGPGPNEIAYVGVHECGLGQIRLQARYKGANVRQIRVYFRDGSSQVEMFPVGLRVDQYSQVLDLALFINRCVTGVAILGHGEGQRNDGLISVIELYGRMALPPTPPPPRQNY